MRRQRFDQINMIPFIDIMLVLLAIVLTTASFVSQGLIPVELPSTEIATQQSSDQDSIVLTVDADTQLYWGVESDEVLSMAEVTQRLESADVDTEVVFRVDKAANFDGFFGLYQTIKTLGFTNVYIEAETLTP